MAIVTLTAAQVIALKAPRSKYPWYTTEVGAGFFVPAAEVPRRPSIPCAVKQMGIKWKTASATLPETGEPGYLMLRIA